MLQRSRNPAETKSYTALPLVLNLLNASETYQKSAALMKEFTTIFLFRPQGQMKLQDRKTAANILRKVKPLEEQAIQRMQKALDNWETS